MPGSAAAASAAASVSGAERRKADLSDINGIGPGYQKRLEEHGVSLRDIAEWTADDVDRWQSTLKARIRDGHWVEQAQELIVKEAAEAAEEPEAPEPPAKPPSRAEVIQRMVKQSAAPEPASDDPLSGYSEEEVAELARKHIASQPKAQGPLQKRGSVTHLRAVVAQPTFVPFNRVKNVLKRLDRNKKFATILGDHHSAHYSQKSGREGTRYFDHEGIEIPFGENGKPLSSDEIAELYVEDEHIAADVDEINLKNWELKVVDYPLDLVAKRIYRDYRKRLDTERAMRQFCHEVFNGHR